MGAVDHLSQRPDHGGGPGEKGGINRRCWVTAGGGLAQFVRKGVTAEVTVDLHLYGCSSAFLFSCSLPTLS